MFAAISLTPDQMMLGGLAIVGVMFTTFHPKVQQFISGLTSKVNPANLIPDEDLNVIGEIESPEDVHEVVSALIDYFKKTEDVEGIKCAAKIGNHVYENQIAKALPSTLPIKKD